MYYESETPWTLRLAPRRWGRAGARNQDHLDRRASDAALAHVFATPILVVLCPYDAPSRDARYDVA